ncbi:MAG: prephenate dehydratase [Thermodesulfobacteriota bacterium]
MAKKKDLSELRKKIDDIDSKLLKLVNERGEIALEVSSHKKANSLRVYDPAREKEIEEKLKKKNPGPLSNEYVVSIFREVISACRALQHNTRVAYLGPEGSFSNQAAFNKFGSGTELVAVSSFEEVFEEVHKNRVEFGIVPVENSLEGSIGRILDMLFVWDLKISAEYFEKIGHFLLSKTGSMSDIRVVASHPQALGQCRNWISKNLSGVELVETPSTAWGARLASEDNSVASIASEFSASIYKLKIIQKHIEDSPQNTTRFLIIGKETGYYTGEDKTSIVFSLKDEPGALHKSLFLPFAEAKINLTKIESRPSKEMPWEYLFFVDFKGHFEEKKVVSVLKKVEKNCIFLKVLGSYQIGTSK